MSSMTQPQVDIVSTARAGPEAADGADHSGATVVARVAVSTEVTVAWKAFALSCESTIFELLDVYMDIVYPL